MATFVYDDDGTLSTDPITLEPIPTERALKIRGHWYDARSIVDSYRAQRADRLPYFLRYGRIRPGWISARNMQPFDVENRMQAMMRSGYERQANNSFTDDLSWLPNWALQASNNSGSSNATSGHGRGRGRGGRGRSPGRGRSRQSRVRRQSRGRGRPRRRY